MHAYRPRLTRCLLSLAVATASLGAAAQQEPVQLDTVRVVSTAAGYEQDIKDAPASISVVTRDDLQTRQYRDLAEALADVEGVDVRGSTGKTGGLDISIRGMPSDYTLILIDGRRQNVAGDVTPNGFGAALTSFMPPLSAIERIEVVRGPMSTLYGSDAMGGVVNIITRKVAPEWGGAVRLEAGLPQDNDWGTEQKTDIYVNGPLIDGVLGLAVRGGTYHREASAYIVAPGATPSGRNPAPAESRQYNIGARLTYTPSSDHELWLDMERGLTWYNNDDGRLGSRNADAVAPTDDLPGYKDYMRLNRDQIAVGHSSRLGIGQLESSVSYATTETLGRTIPGELGDIGTPFSGFPNIIIGDDRELVTTNTVFDTKYVAPLGDAHTVTVGGQWWEAELEDGLLPEKHDQTLAAVFIEDEWRFTDSLAATFGGRYDDHDAFGGHFSPRAYLVWNTTDQVTLKGGVSQGFRAPRLNQLIDGISGISGQGQTINIGNPNLEPETSTNTELALLFDNYQGLAGSVTLFHNEIEDRITGGEGDCAVNPISSCAANPTATYAVNIDKAKTWGAELSGRLPLADDWSLQLSYTWTDSEVTESGQDNGKLSNTPKHRGNATLRWAATERLNLWLRGEYRGEAKRFSGRTADLTGNNALIYQAVGDLKAYSLFHLGGAYQVSERVTLNANVFNLLDKEFRKYTTYVDTSSNLAWASEYFQTGRSVDGGVHPGRTFWLSVNMEF